MTALEQFQVLGISLLLGLLVGLQREVVKSKLAGFRTFPLITLLGTFCGLLAPAAGTWVIFAGFLGIVAVVVVGNVLRLKEGDSDAGMTTEVAMLLMYAIGVYLVLGPTLVAVAAAGVVAILLHLKPEMHGFAYNLTRDDLRAIMQFVLITFIILPILPNETFGPFSVINPFKTWLLVVLIVGISLTGYLVYRFCGHRAGTLLGGLLGGMISSTATTVSYSRMSHGSREIARLATVVIMVASTVMYARVLVEILIVAPSFFPIALPRILFLMGLGVLLSLILWRGIRRDPVSMPEQKNPSELRAALTFAALYTAIFLLVAATREYAGDRALYLVASISGLTDLDAITLSTAQMVESGRIEPDLGWRLIVTALAANFCFKGAVATALGGRRLLSFIFPPFAVSILAGLALIAFA